MSEKKFDLLVFIGRMRMPDLAHEYVIERGLEAAHNVLALIGSANRPRTFKNPWTATEVSQMLRLRFPSEDADGGRLAIQPLDDWMHDNDFTWLMNVHRAVENECRRIQQWTGRETTLRVGLIGYSKDHTSYYLKKFPQWGSIDVGAFKHKGTLLHASDLRREFLIAPASVDLLWQGLDNIRDRLSVPVNNYLHSWVFKPQNIEVVSNIREAVQFAKEYKEEHQFRGALNPETGLYEPKPYEPIMTTVDSVIIQSGHVLMGRRKFNPGKGLWALMGGFAHADEWLRDANARERSEESRIKLTRQVLDLAFRFKHVFSDPNRSDDRGRIITHAYLHVLNDRRELPETEGADDILETRWFPLGLLDPNEIYSDHFWIIHKMLALMPVD